MNELYELEDYHGVQLRAISTDRMRLSLLLKISAASGAVGVMYPLETYAQILEFRAMLAHPMPSKPGGDWVGQFFFGFADGDGPDHYHWRGRGHGITISVTAKQWVEMQDLFVMAFAKPTLADAWELTSAKEKEK